MPMCEKCWGDAYVLSMADPAKTQTDHYLELIKERTDNPCSPRDQAGQFWDEERKIDSRAEDK